METGDDVPADRDARRLCERLARFPSRRWAGGYLRLVRVLLRATELPSDDPRLVTSIPLEGPYPLPVTINNRYVLTPRVRRGQWSLCFVYGAEYESQPDLTTRATALWRFDAQRNEGLNTPFFLCVSEPDLLLEDDRLLDGWLDACGAELGRARASSNRRAHQPLFLRAARDERVGQVLLDAAFPDT